MTVLILPVTRPTRISAPASCVFRCGEGRIPRATQWSALAPGVRLVPRARSPGGGRNDRMCASQKAWFAVTEREEREPVVAGGVLVALLGLLGVVDGPGGGVAAAGPAGRGDRVITAWVVAHVLQDAPSCARRRKAACQLAGTAHRVGIPGRWPRSTPTSLTGTRSPGWCSSAAPRGWPCASPADERTRELARRRLPPRRPGSLPGSTRKGCSRAMLRASPHGNQRLLGKKEST